MNGKCQEDLEHVKSFSKTFDRTQNIFNVHVMLPIIYEYLSTKSLRTIGLMQLRWAKINQNEVIQRLSNDPDDCEIRDAIPSLHTAEDWTQGRQVLCHWEEYSA